eukprot:CAMPEP_0176108242 /NCGR_PEP_ID=MMETSP0120_2-20121206/54336_1 /TAXON_ID=160619 /ORGANISM="Kryptoperidinium foliaceum, Strain CCMP 1326" /LENGTH=68 /DNA_ID=CAMNT_0017442405 /DNA_START=10 /DNA_END=212 /DNA_ORIENTATION=+
MKFFFVTVVVNLAATASAFQVARGGTQATTTSTTTSLDMSSHHLVTDFNELSESRDEDILQALGSMEG